MMGMKQAKFVMIYKQNSKMRKVKLCPGKKN